MTTAIALASAQLPAYLSELGGSSILDNATSGLKGGQTFPRISIKASRFRIIEDGVEQTLNTLALSAVIVGANSALSKQYYEGAFDADNASGPTCFSEDGVAPDPEANEPQNDRCATCPKAAWGSKISPNGKETKACSDLKRLAVVSRDDIEGSVYELTITPAALAGFKKYATELKARRIPVEIAVTIIGFDPSASFPKLTFAFGGFLDRDEAMKAREVAMSDMVKDIVRQKDVVAQAIPAQIPVKPAAKPVAAPAPVVETQQVVEEAPAPAPVKKAKGFGGAAPAPAAAPAPKAKPAAKPAAAAPAAPAPDVSDFEAELAEFAASGAADDAEE